MASGAVSVTGGARPGGAPAAACEVGCLVLGGDDGRLQVLVPDAGRPVADGQEELGEEGGTHERVDGAMVPCSATGVAFGQQLHEQQSRSHRHTATTTSSESAGMG